MGFAHVRMPEERAILLLLVVFFVFLVLFFDDVAVFACLFLVFLIVLVVFFIQIIGDEIQMDGMRLRNLELGFTLGTAQDLAFFHFVFVHIDFRGTFRATDHGTILRTGFRKVGAMRTVPATVQRIIYRVARSQLPAGASLLFWSPRRGFEDPANDLIQRVP
jgi:hypothetical protein